MPIFMSIAEEPQRKSYEVPSLTYFHFPFSIFHFPFVIGH